MGKTCAICGKPSGMYPLCREHLKMKAEGKVVKCEDCGVWHLIDEPCDCEDEDFNDDEIVSFAELSAKYNIICRFIEFMPIGNSENWSEKNIVYGDEIIKRLKDFEPKEMPRDKNSGPAVNYKLNNGGIVGIITPISKHFCSECDKLRITADGKIRPCLLSDNEIDIKEALQARDKEMLVKQIMQSLNIKHDEHNITIGEQNHDFKRTMSKIGG